MSKPSDKILERLRALLARTTENGASENEAMIAAQKAAALMVEHNLSVADIEEKSEFGVLEDRDILGTGQPHEVWKLLLPINRLTDTEGFRMGKRVVLYGRAPDCAFAMHLLHVIKRAMDLELARYRASQDYKLDRQFWAPLRLKNDFLTGMRTRIWERLEALDKERRAAMQARTTPAGTTGQEVMVVRDQELQERFQDFLGETKVRDKTERRKPSERIAHAVIAGHHAGGNVNLEPGLEADPGPGRLTGSRDG